MCCYTLCKYQSPQVNAFYCLQPTKAISVIKISHNFILSLIDWNSIVTIITLSQIQEYTRKKNEREIAFERELQKQKLLKEKSIAKIQASQQATYDLRATKDELNALRVRDQVNVVPTIKIKCFWVITFIAKKKIWQLNTQVAHNKKIIYYSV